MSRLRIVRKADFGPAPAPELTPEQILAQMEIAEQLIQTNGNVQSAIDQTLQNLAGEAVAEAAQYNLQALATKAWQDSLGKVQTPMLQQIVNFANSDESVNALEFKTNFTMTNPDAISMASKQAGDLAVQLTKEQHEIIRKLTALSVSGEMTVDELGRRLRNHIGLFDKWAKAVENRYAQTYKDYIKQGFDKTTAQAMAQKASAQYHARLLRKRCLMIARTEVLRAENDGRWLGWKSAIDEGYADPNSFKQWIVRPIGACEVCQALNGTKIPYDQPFGFGQLMPPRHPNCRCTAVLVAPPADYKPAKPPKDLLKPSGYDEHNAFQGNLGGAIPSSAPDYAKPVAWNGQLDIGDIIFFDGMQGVDGYEISSITNGKVYYKTKTGTSPINVGDLLARGKAVAIVPGPAKLSKVTIKPDPDAYAPTGAPTNAIAVNQITSIGVGDTLYTSTLKAGQSMSVIAVDVDGQRLKVMGTTGSVYWTPFNSSKNLYAIVPSANKVKTLMGMPADNVFVNKAPTKTAAGDKPAFKPYQPAIGDVVALDGDTSTHKIVDIVNGKATLDNGQVIPVKGILGLPAGSKVMTDDGVVHAVVEVAHGVAKLENGDQVPVSALKPAKNFMTIGDKLPDPTPAPAEPAKTGTAAVLDANIVMGKQIAQPTGSNKKHPSGMWQGTDGVKRYVKNYENPEQAVSEYIANRIYADMGANVPKTSLSSWINPKTGATETLIVTEIVENDGTLGSKPLTVDKAKAVVDDFILDAWLANYDAVGTGLDNVVLGKDGKMYRIDQGGSLFFRAMGGKKSDTELATVDVNAFYTKNDYYKKVFDKVGIKPDQINADDFFTNLDDVVGTKGGMTPYIQSLFDDIATDSKTLNVGIPKTGGTASKAYVDLLMTRLLGVQQQFKYKPQANTPKAVETPSTPVTTPKKDAIFAAGDFIDKPDIKVGMVFETKQSLATIKIIGIEDGWAEFEIIGSKSAVNAVGSKNKTLLSDMLAYQQNTYSNQWKFVAVDDAPNLAIGSQVAADKVTAGMTFKMPDTGEDFLGDAFVIDEVDPVAKIIKGSMQGKTGAIETELKFDQWQAVMDKGWTFGGMKTRDVTPAVDPTTPVTPKEFKAGDNVPFEDVKIGMLIGKPSEKLEIKITEIKSVNGKPVIQYEVTAGTTKGTTGVLSQTQWSDMFSTFGYEFKGYPYTAPAKSATKPTAQLGSTVYNVATKEAGIVTKIEDGKVTISYPAGWGMAAKPDTVVSLTTFKQYATDKKFLKKSDLPPTYGGLSKGDKYTFVNGAGQEVTMVVTDKTADKSSVTYSYWDKDTNSVKQDTKYLYPADWEAIIAQNTLTTSTTPTPAAPKPQTLADTTEPKVGLKMSNGDETVTILGETIDGQFIVKSSNSMESKMLSPEQTAKLFKDYQVDTNPNAQPDFAIVPKHTWWEPKTTGMTGVIDVPGVSFYIKWMSGDKVHLVDAEGNVYKNVPKSALTGPAPGLTYTTWKGVTETVQYKDGSYYFQVYSEGATTKKTLGWGKGATNYYKPAGKVPAGWIPGKAITLPPPPPKPKPEAVIPVMHKLGGIVTVKQYPGNTYTITDVLPNNKFKIVTSTGKTFEVDGDSMGALGKGAIVKNGGDKLQVMDVESLSDGDFMLTFSDETQMKLSALVASIENGQSSIANKEGSSAVFAGKYATQKAPSVQGKSTPGVPYGVEYTHSDGAKTFATDTEGVEWAKKESASWRRSTTTGEQEAIRSYTGSSYRDMNSALRMQGTGNIPDLDKIYSSTAQNIREVVAALDKSSVSEDVIVSRGLSVSSAVKDTYLNLPEGALLFDGAFQSTSVGPNAAFSGDVVLRIRIKKGQKAAFVANLSQYKGEREFLIQAGSTMKVNKVQVNARGQAVVDVTIVDQTPLKGVPNPKDISIVAKAKTLLFSILTDLTLGKI